MRIIGHPVPRITPYLDFASKQGEGATTKKHLDFCKMLFKKKLYNQVTLCVGGRLYQMLQIYLHRETGITRSCTLHHVKWLHWNAAPVRDLCRSIHQSRAAVRRWWRSGHGGGGCGGGCNIIW